MRSTVLTLAIDDAAQAYFDGLRQKYYPPALNRIGAHVTLFHQLPLTGEAGDSLREIARGVQRFEAVTDGLQFLGRGVAVRVDGAELLAVHRVLRARFEDVLIPQDRQKFQPHIVVQNKVTPEQARATMETLRVEVERATLQCVGLDWWEYVGGPWKHLERFHFAG